MSNIRGKFIEVKVHSPDVSMDKFKGKLCPPWGLVFYILLTVNKRVNYSLLEVGISWKQC